MSYWEKVSLLSPPVNRRDASHKISGKEKKEWSRECWSRKRFKLVDYDTQKKRCAEKFKVHLSKGSFRKAGMDQSLIVRFVIEPFCICMLSGEPQIKALRKEYTA